MAKDLCSDNTNARMGEDELEFINDMKKVPSHKNLTSKSSSKDLQIYHELRRNSSFAEYFEGDLSQNLLSRSHFTHRDSGVHSDAVNAIVKHIKTEECRELGLVFKKGEGGEGRKKNLSKVNQIMKWLLYDSHATFL
jgi:hypothetical protein